MFTAYRDYELWGPIKSTFGINKIIFMLVYPEISQYERFAL